jgi:4-amino-4-deoxy-L-arabinose transferase-like glycosyltransferase
LTANPQSPRQSAVTVSLAALAILVCLFGHLGAIGLVGPDEPRYAWIARDMAATGDWVTPRLYGQPWFEKPVLYYWAAAVGFDLQLPPEWAARLPSALAALAAALAIGWLAWKHYGAEPELPSSPTFLAPLLFSSSVAAIGFARAATPDMLFTASLTLAMAAAASVLHRAGALRGAQAAPANALRRDSVPLTFFGACLGLAALAKGPAGVVLSGGAIGLWALATNRWRAAIRLAHPLAITVFCIVALPWYILCARRNPDFISVFIYQHNLDRYLTPVFQHKQPFWFFGSILLVALLPWTLLLIPAAWEGLRLWREKSWSNSPGLFFSCWAVFPILFFSFSQSKLPGYILPAIPPLILLFAVASTRLMNSDSPSARWIDWALAFTWVVMGLSAALWMHRLPPGALENVGRTIFICALLAIGGGIAIAGLGHLRKRIAIPLSLLLIVLLVETAGARVLPALDPYLSARQHAATLHNDRRPDRIFTYHLNRSWDYGLAFYLGREIPEWSASDLEAALLLTTPQGLEELRRLGRFSGTLDETYRGVLYVPVLPAPR